VRRGEVWWHEHPRRGRRPYLILTRDESIPVLQQVLAVPATRTIRDIPTEVVLGRADGMPSACCVTLDNLTVIRTALCVERITRLSTERMREVCVALALATACDTSSGSRSPTLAG
jgi:mRNA interferase MazF